jgi:hypothetical protein
VTRSSDSVFPRGTTGYPDLHGATGGTASMVPITSTTLPRFGGERDGVISEVGAAHYQGRRQNPLGLGAKPSAGASTTPTIPKRTARRLSAPSCSRRTARRAWPSIALPLLIAQGQAESADLEGEGMSSRVADDFESIRSRMEELKRERQPAPLQPTSPLPPADQSDERPWEWDGFCPR